MNTIRTTIVMDADIHRQLSIQAAMLGVGLSELVNRRLSNKNAIGKARSVDDTITADLAFLKKLSQKTRGINFTQAVREERNRDNA